MKSPRDSICRAPPPCPAGKGDASAAGERGSRVSSRSPFLRKRVPAPPPKTFLEHFLACAGEKSLRAKNDRMAVEKVVPLAPPLCKGATTRQPLPFCSLPCVKGGGARERDGGIVLRGEPTCGSGVYEQAAYGNFTNKPETKQEPPRQKPRGRVFRGAGFRQISARGSRGGARR